MEIFQFTHKQNGLMGVHSLSRPYDHVITIMHHGTSRHSYCKKIPENKFYIYRIQATTSKELCVTKYLAGCQILPVIFLCCSMYRADQIVANLKAIDVYSRFGIL